MSVDMECGDSHKWAMRNWRRAKAAAADLLAQRKRDDAYIVPQPVFYDSYVPKQEPVPVPPQPKIPLTRTESIFREVCAKYGISRDALVGRLRQRNICAARHEAAFRMIVEAGLTYPAAGRRLGGRDHTTILHSVKTHVARDPDAARAWAAFCDIEADDLDARRLECIRLHFEEGWAVGRIVKSRSIGHGVLMRWLIEEARRREQKAA